MTGRWDGAAGPVEPAGLVAAAGRALVGGFAAASAMTATTAIQRRLLPARRGPVDYDASHHVPDAVGAVLGREPRSDVEQQVYFALAHWGYGSAVALAYPPLRAALGGDRAAALAFYAGCEGMALALLPTLGGTPPPHRWSRRLLVSSVVQHAVYVAVVVAVHRALAASAPDR